jgi:hypothetical protein
MPLAAEMAPTMAATIEPSMPEALDMLTGDGAGLALSAAGLGVLTNRNLKKEIIITNERRQVNTVPMPMNTIVHI